MFYDVMIFELEINCCPVKYARFLSVITEGCYASKCFDIFLLGFIKLCQTGRFSVYDLLTPFYILALLSAIMGFVKDLMF